MGRLRSAVVRNRIRIAELSLLAVIMAVLAYVVFEVDVFVHEGGFAARPDAIEIDEALLIGGLFAVGLLVFSVRRYREQKREAVQRRIAEEKIRELAFQDPLTGLANRRQFEDSLAAALAALPGAGAIHALFLLDLNGFKQVNDVHGHNAGDQLLVSVAQRLLLAADADALVARLGGDEFALLALHLAGPEAATTIALRITQAFAEPLVVGNHRHEVSAVLPQDATERDEALRKADVALYRAKIERRTAMRFFEEDMDRLVRERAALESALRMALAQGEIDAVYVPSIDLATGKVMSFEVKPRWHHATLGEVDPDRFLSIAQDIGLIHVLAAYLLTQACRLAVEWPDNISLSIDLFPGQLADRRLKETIAETLRAAGLAPQRLEIEIPESTLVTHMAELQEVLGTLRDIGVRVSLDHFGTGYSSLYHLRNFKIDKVKIDRRFIETMDNDLESATIVNALVGLGRGLGFTLAADGVVRPDRQNALNGIGASSGQGQLYSRPIDAKETLLLTTQQEAFSKLVS
jgi:diguanylate cyclase (GGDEF)-like protein